MHPILMWNSWMNQSLSDPFRWPFLLWQTFLPPRTLAADVSLHLLNSAPLATQWTAVNQQEPSALHLETAAYPVWYCRLWERDLPPYACPQIASLSAFWCLWLLSCGQSLPFHNEGPKIEMDASMFCIAHNKLFLASVLLLVLFPLPGISSLWPHFLYTDPLRVSSSIPALGDVVIGFSWLKETDLLRLAHQKGNGGWAWRG